MLTNCLAECAHLTITVSQIQRDIGRKSSFFHTPCIRRPRVSGVPVGLAPSRLARKNEDIFIRFGATHERDRQTDRRTDTACPAIAALMHSIARPKCSNSRRICLLCFALQYTFSV